MTESQKTNQDRSMKATALRSLADYYSKCGLHALAAETYRRAAELFQKEGNKKASQDCCCARLLSVIAA